jgi:hypothetical protein
MTKSDKEAGINSASAGKERRPYKKPQLAIYGKLAEITAGNNGSVSDHGQQQPTKRGVG